MNGRPLVYVGLGALLFTGCAEYPAIAVQPGVFVNAPEAKVADIAAGATVRHEFTLTSVSENTIAITSLDPGCFGTWTLVGRKIGPGRQIGAVLTVDTAKLGTGTITYRAKLLTDDAGAPELPVAVTVTVRPEFELSARTLDLGTRSPADAPELVTVSVLDGGSSRPLAVRSTDPAVDVELKRKSADRYHLVVTTKRHADAGSHFGNIIVTTSSSLTPELRIPIRGVVEGR